MEKTQTYFHYRTQEQSEVGQSEVGQSEVFDSEADFHFTRLLETLAENSFDLNLYEESKKEAEKHIEIATTQ